MNDKIKEAAIKGEMDAYQHALKSFDKVTPLKTEAAKKLRVRAAYRTGEQDAYMEASELLDEPVAMTEDEQAKRYFAKHLRIMQNRGEQDAYLKAMASFRTVSPTEQVKQVLESKKSGLLIDAPTSLRTAYLMEYGKKVNVKGQFIYQNYQNILAIAKSVAEDAGKNYQLTFKAFQSFATILFIFLEEYESDIYSNKLDSIRKIITNIYNLWPNLVEWTSGRLIRYDTAGTDFSQDPKLISNPNYSSSERKKTDDKVEILSLVMSSRMPDTGEPVYTTADQQNVNTIVSGLNDIVNQLSSTDVLEQITTKAALYEDLMNLRPLLDKTTATIDGILRASKPPELPQVKDIQEIIKYVENLRDNKFMSPELKSDLDLIVKSLSPASVYLGGWWRHPLSRLFGAVSGRTSKEVAKVMEGLKKAEQVYRRVWAAIHSGREIAGQFH